jgi:hypothetical protein
MWEPWPLVTLGASTACNRDIFTFFFYLLLLNPEYGGGMFLRNVGWISTDYTALYHIRKDTSVSYLLLQCPKNRTVLNRHLFGADYFLRSWQLLSCWTSFWPSMESNGLVFLHRRLRGPHSYFESRDKEKNRNRILSSFIPYHSHYTDWAIQGMGI